MQPDDLVREYANYHGIPEEDVFDLAAKDQNIHESQMDIAFCNFYIWGDVPNWVIKFIRTQDEQ